METVKRSVVSGGSGQGRINRAQRIFRAVKLLL